MTAAGKTDEMRSSIGTEMGNGETQTCRFVPLFPVPIPTA